MTYQVGVVVGEQGSADAGGAVGDAGPGEVVRGGEDAVGVVADVGAAVAVAVDAHRREGGGHELHQALGAGAELVRLLRPCPVSSMPMPASSVHGILYLAAAAR